MRSELLYPPGTRPFDETHNAAAGMRVCLSPNGKHVPTGYNWREDSLAPDIDGTIVHIEHRVDSVAVYVCSDDASRHVQPYAVEDLLRLVPPAYDIFSLNALLLMLNINTQGCQLSPSISSDPTKQPEDNPISGPVTNRLISQSV